jgi:hypothetical protein
MPRRTEWALPASASIVCKLALIDYSDRVAELCFSVTAAEVTAGKTERGASAARN